jgi:hypothetical protein
MNDVLFSAIVEQTISKIGVQTQVGYLHHLKTDLD